MPKKFSHPRILQVSINTSGVVFQYLKYIAIKSITFIQELGYTLAGKKPGFCKSDAMSTS
jgi:hypothetical protein